MDIHFRRSVGIPPPSVTVVRDLGPSPPRNWCEVCAHATFTPPLLPPFHQDVEIALNRRHIHFLTAPSFVMN